MHNRSSENSQGDKPRAAPMRTAVGNFLALLLPPYPQRIRDTVDVVKE
jgi:hypothetical protein